MTKRKASKAAIEELHAAIASELARKIQAGEATAADLAVAAKFVKDNGVSVLIDPSTPEGGVLAGKEIPKDVQTADDFDEVIRSWQ